MYILYFIHENKYNIVVLKYSSKERIQKVVKYFKNKNMKLEKIRRKIEL